MNILEAIAKEEGYYVQGSRPGRNNNPGDLEYHDWMLRFNAQREPPPRNRFAVFPTPEAGFAAMKHLFGFPAYKGKTVAQCINTWAPPVENDTEAYLRNVCAGANCLPTDIIDTILEGI